VPQTSGVTPTQSGSNDLKFHPLAIQRLEDTTALYQTTLRKTAEYICVRDDCNEVQEKHVKLGEDTVSRMCLDKVSVGENYQLWWLIAGICLASALALPDASQLFLAKEPDNGTSWPWVVARIFFSILILAGLCCAVVAYFIALGPNQPEWFLDFKRSVSKIASKRPWK
jgi:hypothetical protein